MRYSDIIEQLRIKCASFANRVYGSAEFALIQDQENTDLSIPSAYVLPMADTAHENPNSVGYQQDLQEQFAVVLAVDNKQDRTGLLAADGIHTLRAEVFSGILNWSPDTEVYDPIQYGGGQFLHGNRGILYWRLSFKLTTRLTQEDGYQGTYDDLRDVITGIDMADPNDGSVTGPDGVIDAHANVEDLNI